MRQVRNGVFETNSSSIHSIAIPNTVEKHKTYAYFGFDEFGWSFEEVDHLDYLHTAIYEVYGRHEAEEKIEELKNVLEKHGITCEFRKPKNDDYGYIDHGYELREFLDNLFNDEDLMIRYINGGEVFTGNDNSNAEERAFVERDEPTYEEYNWRTGKSTKHYNPYFMGDGYQWFYKWN